MEAQRKFYLDYLRVIATYSIVVIHVAAQNKYTVSVDSQMWKVFNIYDGLTRWAVSVFVMISGVVFLKRDIPPCRMYSKYILRMVVAFFFWSLLYAGFSCDRNVGVFISEFIHGHYHMWFILMIIGLYICTPIIQKIVQDGFLLKYFLVLNMLFAVLFPFFSTLITDFGNNIFVNGINAVNDSINSLNMKMVLGYAGIYVLGYILDQASILQYRRYMLYVMGVLGVLTTIILDDLVSMRSGVSLSNYSIPLSLNVLVTSSAAFVFFKNLINKSLRFDAYIRKLSSYCFGVYLIHPLIIEQIDNLFGINTLSFNTLFSVIIMSICVFILSMMVSLLLNSIPLFRKYIV